MPEALKNFKIGGRVIGSGTPVYIIAEMSANHNQDFERAIEIVRAAHRAGADAIKLQTYTPDTMTISSNKDSFIVRGNIWEGQSLYDLYRRAQTPWGWHARIKDVAEGLGLDFLSTPYDHSAAQFLEELGVPAYKVASFEIIDIPLLRDLGRTGKPLLVSTGMATLAEIDEAVQTIRETGNSSFALLRCVSAYPTPLSEMNLRTIPHLSSAFGVPVGLSDHSMGIEGPVVAVALGATIIEKHLTLSRSQEGPDSQFSLEPAEFSSMVRAVRQTEEALGSVSYGCTSLQQSSIAYRRSLFVVKDVMQGEELTAENIRSIRPAQGLHPKYLDVVLGCRARHDLERGAPLAWSDIE